MLSEPGRGLAGPGNPVAGDTRYAVVTIRGNYSDREEQVVFNTFLGADGSPSSELVLDGGTASGMIAVVMHPAGTSGALTLANDIRVVETVNGGTIAPGAFVHNGELPAGAFDYRLFRGSLDSRAPQDRFLRPDFTPTMAGVAPAGGSLLAELSTIQPGNVLPLDSPSNVLAQAPAVIYSASKRGGTYGAAASCRGIMMPPESISLSATAIST